MNDDIELAAWQRQWKAEPPSSDSATAWNELRQQVDRQSRRMRIALIAPVLVTIGIGGHFLMQAIRSAQPTDVLVAVEAWTFIAVVWVSCFWVARGTWRPFGETTAAFIDLAIRRCQSNIKAARLGLWLYVGQLIAVYCLVWVMADVRTPPVGPLSSGAVVALGVIGPGIYIVWMTWFVRNQRTELARLYDLQRQLIGTAP